MCSFLFYIYVYCKIKCKTCNFVRHHAESVDFTMFFKCLIVLHGVLLSYIFKRFFTK